MGKKKRRSNIVKGKNPRNVVREKEIALSTTAPTTNTGVRGLNNLGNTCFFNSAVQGLNAAVDLVQIDDETHPGHMHQSLLKTFLSMRDASSSAHNPIVLHQAVCNKFKQFNGRRQQDAHELLLALLSRIQDEQVSLKKVDPAQYNCITDLLRGTLASVIQCSACLKKSVTTSHFNDISISLPGSEKFFMPRSYTAPRQTRSSRKEKEKPKDENIYDTLEVAASSSESSANGAPENNSPTETTSPDTATDPSAPVAEDIYTPEPELVEEPPECALIEPPPYDCESDSSHVLLEYCLSEHVKYETLEVAQGNGYLCPHCSKGVAKRDASKRLLLLDPPKILLLHMKRLLPGGKYSLFVEFPLVLDMKPFAAQRPEQAESYIYNLHSVVVHQGTGSGGHYIAYVLRAKQWYYTSDSQVRKCSTDEVLRASAYMLMYRNANYDDSAAITDAVSALQDLVLVDCDKSEPDCDEDTPY